MTETEINEAIARKLGWKEQYPNCPGIWSPPGATEGQFDQLPDFCHSIAVAWEVVERLDNDFAMFKGYQGGWVVNIKGDLTQSDTAAMVICLAFLKLKEG